MKYFLRNFRYARYHIVLGLLTTVYLPFSSVSFAEDNAAKPPLKQLQSKQSTAIQSPDSTTSITTKALSYTVLKTLPHDPYLFTQGLLTENGQMYESSGLYKRSFVRVYDVATGKIINQRKLSKNLFAEGLAKLNSHLFLLSWRAEKLTVLHSETLKTLYTLPYKGEGWGLTHDGKDFIMSNGSNTLTIRDTNSFRIKEKLTLNGQVHGYPRLNELEFANDSIWANAWMQPYIYKIARDTGDVEGIADLSQLVNQNSTDNSRTVLNGIAFDKTHNAFWVTGKNWPNRYLIQFN